MHVEQRSVIYDAGSHHENARATFFDGMLQLESGIWLAGFFVGKTKHHHQGTIRLAKSADDGASWELLPFRFDSVVDGVPGSLTGAEMVEVEPGRLLLFSTWFDRSDPERPLFNPETEGILRSKQLMAVSTDDGESWSEWTEISTAPLTGAAMTGPIQKWSDGAIAFTFESFKEFDDPEPALFGAWLLTSRDGGRTFDERFSTAQAPDGNRYYWDQRLCPGSEPGEFVAMFWTHDRARQRDLNVHFLRASIHDGERSASAPVETTIPGQIAAPLLLGDGRILAFVVDRERPGTMKLWQSSDGGLTWPQAESLVIHNHDEQAAITQGCEDIDFAEFWEDMGKWSFGHPSIRLAGSEHVMLSWYAGTPDCMDVLAARVRV